MQRLSLDQPISDALRGAIMALRSYQYGNAAPDLAQSIADAGDNASRELFERLLKDEEEHVDFLETQLHLVAQIGLERYLAQQMGGADHE